MKTVLRISILLIGLILLCSCVSGNTYPTLNGYVTDNANILTPQEKLSLSNRIASIENSTSVEIALVTVQSTNGETLSQYATKVGDTNGVGKKGTDNGIVVLVSFENERGIFIATGQGIESVVTDVESNRIYTSSKSYFSNKQYNSGFNSILDGIESELKKDDSATTESVSMPQIDNSIYLIACAIILIVSGIIVYMVTRDPPGSYYITSTMERPRNRSARRERLSDSLATAAAVSSFSSYRSRDSDSSSSSSYHSSNDDSSSSSSFGGFGGGGFGGGGAGGGF
jgi:uncharacterized protein